MNPGAQQARGLRGRHLSVALVGADGAGKSTVSALLKHADLPRPVKVVYMGVNLEASTVMLPTTRLLLAAKKARGGRPDLTGSTLREIDPTTDEIGSSPVSRRWSIKEPVRLSIWMLEEWFRQALATSYSLRGYIVVFDRHFFADYYHADVRDRSAARTPFRRLHGWMLEHAYPKPDLVIMLDAPPENLHARKPEATVEWLRRRRAQYLELADVVPEFVVLDVDRPIDPVVTDAAELIRSAWKERS